MVGKPRLNEAWRIKRIADLVASNPRGLCLSEVIEKAKQNHVLANPNLVHKYLEEAVKAGILTKTKVKGGRGLPKTVYKCLYPAMHIEQIARLLKQAPDTALTEAAFRSMFLDKELEQLQKKPVEFWFSLLRNAAEKAGLLENIKNPNEREEFFSRMIDATSPHYIAAAMSLIHCTELSFILVKSILGSILLTAFATGKHPLDVLRKRFKIAALDWEELMTKASISSFETWRAGEEMLKRLASKKKEEAENVKQSRG
jgi:hypothetical protein